MQKISCILVVRNEEANIGACLETIKWVDEIIIIDQSSTDSTVEIARKFTDKVFTASSKGFSEPDIPIAASKASYDWILYIEPDQRLTPELKEELQSVLNSDYKYTSYYIPTKNILLGKWIKGAG
jgi:glycosyltransferase involved in cell wall biosynthesis